MIGRVGTALRDVLGRVFVDAVRSGRPRDVGWPSGFRPVVIAGVSVFGLGLVLTALSGLLRAQLPLSSAELRSIYVLPRPTVSVLLFMIVFTLVLAQTAALHSAWWIRILITATTVGVMGLWGIRKPTLSYPGVVLSIGALMVALLAFVIIRAKFSFAWWECPAVLLLVGGSAVLSLIEDARGIANGVDLAPVFLQETMLSLGSLAVPVLFAAGLSVAEVTVSATVWSARIGQRLVNTPTALVIAVVAILIWTAHAAVQITHWDLIRTPPSSMVFTSIVAGAFALLALWWQRVGRRRGPQPAVALARLPELMSRFGFPIGVGLSGGAIVLIVVVGLVATGLLLNPLGSTTRSAGALITEVAARAPSTSGFVVLAAVLLGLAWRSARISRPSVALLLGCVSVMLLAAAGNDLSRDSLTINLNLAVLNLMAGAVLVVAGVVWAARRRLSRQRAVTLTVGLVLSGLASGRDFVSDPVQAVLGISGVGLAMFGLAWDLLTGSEWANRDGPRLPVPSRLLLVLANSTLGSTVLAYISLARQSGGPADPEAYSHAGDLILGTALVVATFIVILGHLRADSEVR